MPKFSYEEDKKIEKAIVFLVRKLEESGNNPKPVILHSIRVGIYLYKSKYSLEVVLAGLLHDLIEDSDTTLEEIEGEFGKKVASLVSASTFDESIEDKVEQYDDSFKRGTKVGKEALLVRAADLLDNAPYYDLTWAKYGKDKIGSFLEYAEQYINDEPVYDELLEALKKIKPRK